MPLLFQDRGPKKDLLHGERLPACKLVAIPKCDSNIRIQHIKLEFEQAHVGKERDEVLEEPMDELLDNMATVKALVADVIECPLEALLEKVVEDGEFKIEGVVLERRGEVLVEPRYELLDNMVMVMAPVAEVVECLLKALLGNIFEDEELDLEDAVLGGVDFVGVLELVPNPEVLKLVSNLKEMLLEVQ
ncbi:MAG: hypothetical protein ASARMPREDX12_003731 [Alectoria sarmentosa]|nr:MAG: hypothetical protein ASARMPREDX12_003731 [Alectoria sarmentosa]